MEKILTKKEKFESMVNKLSEFLQKEKIKHLLCVTFLDDEADNKENQELHHKTITSEFKRADIKPSLGEYEKMLKQDMEENIITVEKVARRVENEINNKE